MAGDAAMDAGAAPAVEPHEQLMLRLGQMTRALHDNLRELGLDKMIQQAAQDIPDARSRLDYVARMTEQAAQRVLAATEAALPLQDGIDGGARELAATWRAVLALPAAPQPAPQLAQRTLAYLDQASGASQEARAHLMDIMMAQDFQDLTGQVIKKVTELAHSLEQQLVQLLVDFAPQDLRREAGSGLLNGPQIQPEGNPDVVANQGQVDDLLESLGF